MGNSLPPSDGRIHTMRQNAGVKFNTGERKEKCKKALSTWDRNNLKPSTKKENKDTKQHAE